MGVTQVTLDGTKGMFAKMGAVGSRVSTFCSLGICISSLRLLI